MSTTTLFIISLLAMIGTYQGAKHLRSYIWDRFGHDYFSPEMRYWLIAAALCVAFAYYGFSRRLPNQHIAEIATRYWIALILAIAVLSTIAVINIYRTNLTYGLLGILMLIPVAMTILAMDFLGLFGLSLDAALKVQNYQTTAPAPFEEQQKAHEAWMTSDLNKDSPNYRFKNDPNGGY